jgi:hypothetical protein
MFKNDTLKHSGAIYGGKTKITIIFSKNFVPINGMIYFNAVVNRIAFHAFK